MIGEVDSFVRLKSFEGFLLAKNVEVFVFPVFTLFIYYLFFGWWGSNLLKQVVFPAMLASSREGL